MLNLTQKETLLLQDQKSHEKTCVEKYSESAKKAQDPVLQQLFTQLSNQEKQHLDTINQILNGQIPNTTNQQGGTQGSQSQFGTGEYNQQDAQLCEDLLMTEKYVSSTYNTAIFEFRDTNLRQTLNHIQKEEQQHGEDLFKYMESRNMYNPQ
ncbi:spore coat protein [Sporosalibacterium faouarense]|uniref:spore coat protein n=1 Tax=Sporosalibacterium faouarense TaxID=516123 RepID=UPI00141C4DF1|nr:spore coat protein [Sporosalibacterium faouarense]MTI49579.1 spore coat protein [Bacillota bacterium]